uniref:Uncharacterized protein n=1 Tax=Ananas comosus var. bracteatus TaxID=296719 RepID=A0A6V7PGD6_ANACO|nr:unnamed protein product [Ananas comosus var. bracteatus]
MVSIACMALASMAYIASASSGTSAGYMSCCSGHELLRGTANGAAHSSATSIRWKLSVKPTSEKAAAATRLSFSATTAKGIQMPRVPDWSAIKRLVHANRGLSKSAETCTDRSRRTGVRAHDPEHSGSLWEAREQPEGSANSAQSGKIAPNRTNRTLLIQSEDHRAPFRTDRGGSGSSETKTHSNKPYFGLGRSKLAPAGLRLHDGARRAESRVRGGEEHGAHLRWRLEAAAAAAEQTEPARDRARVPGVAAATAAAGELRDGGGGLQEVGGVTTGWPKVAAALGRGRTRLRLGLGLEGCRQLARRQRRSGRLGAEAADCLRSGRCHRGGPGRRRREEETAHGSLPGLGLDGCSRRGGGGDRREGVPGHGGVGGRGPRRRRRAGSSCNPARLELGLGCCRRLERLRRRRRRRRSAGKVAGARGDPGEGSEGGAAPSLHTTREESGREKEREREESGGCRGGRRRPGLGRRRPGHAQQVQGKEMKVAGATRVARVRVSSSKPKRQLYIQALLGVEVAPLDPLDLLDAHLVDAEGGEGLHDGVAADGDVHLAQLLAIPGADHAANDLCEVGDGVDGEKWSAERDPRPPPPLPLPQESSRLAP